MIDIVSQEHLAAAREVKEVVGTYREAEDLINIGAYAKGSNPRIDFALSVIENVDQFLKQGIFENYSYDETQSKLLNLLHTSKQDSDTVADKVE